MSGELESLPASLKQIFSIRVSSLHAAPGCHEKPGAVLPVVPGVALHLRLPCVISSAHSVLQFFKAISKGVWREAAKKRRTPAES